MSKATAPTEFHDMSVLTDDAIDKRIKDVRTGTVQLTVLGSNGVPMANTPVTIRQTNHAFNFGIVTFHYDLGRETAYNKRLTDVFNFAVHPVYFSGYEPEKGYFPWEKYHIDVAKSLQHKGFRSKGHPLCWHAAVPDWVTGTHAEVRKIYLDRIHKIVSRHAGLIDIWDVCNEPVYSTCWDFESTVFSNMLQHYGVIDFLKEAHAVAREANPNAILTMNDYDTSDDGLRFLDKCIEEEVDFDVIGIQSHMYAAEMDNVQHWELFTRFKEMPELWNSCERFSRFGKPIHFTELDICSGKDKSWPGFVMKNDWHSTPEGEQRQMEYAIQTYRILFSHPSVETITWWDFEDPGFMNAPIGLLHSDCTPKPAYHAVKQLIKQVWWTGPMDVKTNEHGQVLLDGFFGEYEIDAPMGRKSFRHTKNAEGVTVQL